MHPAASLRLLLFALGVALLLPCASAAPLAVDAAAAADAGTEVQADAASVSSTVAATTDASALPPEVGQVSGLAAQVTSLQPLPSVDARLPVVGVEVQADADLGLAPDAQASGPTSVHPDDPGSGDAMLELASDAAPAAITAVGLTALGFALRFLFGLLPAGLFSRIDRSQLLDNPVRARVHDAVANEPGVTLSEVQARAGIAWGTTVHHLRRLEANGLVVSVAQNAHRRYFIANTPAAAQRVPLSAILHPTARRIATLVAAQDGIGRSGVCSALGLNGPAASKHLEQFRRHGLVTSVRDGRRTRHHATPGLHAVLGLLEGHAPSVLGVQGNLATPGTRVGAPHMSVRHAGLSLTAA